jgi:hypothetical protein
VRCTELGPAARRAAADARAKQAAR